MLLTTWLAMVARWRSAFAQDRSFHRFLWVLLGLLATQGRGTLTAALGFFGHVLQWSADHHAFSRSQWDERALFRGVIHECAPYLLAQPRLLISLDDTGLPKSGRKIQQISWLRDPLGPKFKVNLVRGLRCLHAILNIPPQAEDQGTMAFSVGFELAPPPKKPKRFASDEDRQAFRALQKTQSLTARGSALLKTLHQDCDAAGLTQPILAVVDGGYTNKTLITQLPERTHLIGRVRKDIRICEPAHGPGRTVYGELLPTPESLRQDTCPERGDRLLASLTISPL
jgi:hypothetical protein